MKNFLLLLLTFLFPLFVSAQLTYDSWHYKNEKGEVRYDLPKYRLQILDQKARQYHELDTLYRETQSVLTETLMNSIYLREKIMQSQDLFVALWTANSELIKDYNDIYDKYNKMNIDYRNMSNEVKGLKKERNKFRRQRNVVLIGVAAMVAAVIIVK